MKLLSQIRGFWTKISTSRVRTVKGELAEITCAEGLGHDLGGDQDREREEDRSRHRGRVAPEDDGLGARAGGADRVRDGVQAEDRRERSIDVGLHLPQHGAELRAFLLQLRGVGRRHAEEHRLEHGAEEGQRKRTEDVGDEQCHREAGP